MLETGLDETDVTFESERNLITWAAGLAGGGTVAAEPGLGVRPWNGPNEQIDTLRANV